MKSILNILTIAFLIQLGTRAAFAVPPEPNEFTTEGNVYSINNIVYSPTEHYGGQLRIRVDEPSITVAIVDAGIAHQQPVNVTPLLQEAVNMWNSLLAHINTRLINPLHITILDQDSSLAPNFRIRAATEQAEFDFINLYQNRTVSPTLAITINIFNRARTNYVFQPSGTFPEPGIYFSGRNIVISGFVSRDYIELLGPNATGHGDVNYQFLAEEIVYHTLSHEIGHALGLAHPGDRFIVPSQDGGADVLTTRRIVDLSSNLPPIMISNTLDRLREARRYIPGAVLTHAPVRRENVRPSRVELGAILTVEHCARNVRQGPRREIDLNECETLSPPPSERLENATIVDQLFEPAPALRRDLIIERAIPMTEIFCCLH
ncbi:TPA: hypothetical protein ACWMEO_004576 [Pseudomonas aeruginosa]